MNGDHFDDIFAQPSSTPASHNSTSLGAGEAGDSIDKVLDQMEAGRSVTGSAVEFLRDIADMADSSFEDVVVIVRSHGGVGIYSTSPEQMPLMIDEAYGEMLG